MQQQPECAMPRLALTVSPFSGETGTCSHAVINTGKAYAHRRLT